MIWCICFTYRFATREIKDKSGPIHFYSSTLKLANHNGVRQSQSWKSGVNNGGFIAMSEASRRHMVGYRINRFDLRSLFHECFTIKFSLAVGAGAARSLADAG
jgi:hypothetical protein